MNKGVPGQDFPGSDLGMAVQVLKNRHGRETMHSMGAGFTLVFVKLAPFRPVPLCLEKRKTRRPLLWLATLFDFSEAQAG